MGKQYTNESNNISSTSATPSQEAETKNESFIEYGSFVFPDFRAVYQSGIKSMKNIVYEEVEVIGFEIYMVEQWAARRKLCTLITSYNGNTQDKIRAVKILLPKDTTLWPESFKKYHQELLVYASPKVVDNNTFFITNLSSIPSALNMLHIDCGDFRVIWEEFKINYDLKRLRCVGRSALLLSSANSTSGNKFLQLYKIPLKSHSDTNQLQMEWDVQQPLNPEEEVLEEPGLQVKNKHKSARAYPVIELVTIVQTCLHYFSLFAFPKERNGLLCDYTKKGINEWWNIYGKVYLGIDRPRNEATMGPTTVAAIVSLVLSCYFKLMVTGSMSGKEPFDEEDFFAGVYSFQKKYGLSKKHTRTTLDEATVTKLFQVSAKISNTDIFNFKTVVKSTMQDITGKGNFIQLSNDILTSDLDSLITNIHSGKLSIIWKNVERTTKDLIKIRKRDFTEFKFRQGDLESVLHQQQLHFERIKLEAISKLRNASEKYLDSKYDSHLSMKNLVDQSEKTSVYSDISNGGMTNKSQLYYKNEYFRRSSIACPDDHHGDFRKINSVDLSRSSSLSNISGALEVWDLPFDASVVRIARDMLRAEHMLLGDGDEDSNLEDISSFAEEADKNQRDYDGDLNDDSEVNDFQQFKNTTMTMKLEHNKIVKNSRIFEEYCEGLENKNLILSKEMKELESLASQMKYNIRILNTRMRDVEVNVKRFDSELCRIDKIFAQLQPNVADAVDGMEDEVSFNKYMNDLITAENTKYGGLFVKLADRNFLDDVKNDIKRWMVWAFEGLLFKDHESNVSS